MWLLITDLMWSGTTSKPSISPAYRGGCAGPPSCRPRMCSCSQLTSNTPIHHPESPVPSMYFTQFFSLYIISHPVLSFLLRNKVSNTVHHSACATQSQTQTYSSYSWRNAPALQIIVWFAGSVTNYWRMFEVYNLTQRPQPHVVSKNRRILTLHTISFFFRKQSSGPVETLWELRTGLDPWAISVREQLHFVFSNGSHLSLCVTSSKLEQQQEQENPQ